MMGKADDDRDGTSEQSCRFCRGNGDGMYAQWIRRNTGSPSGDPQLGSTGNSRELGRAVWGGGEARTTVEAG
jgi:hypothetical protein